MNQLDKLKLKYEFWKHRPWISQFIIDGTKCGGFLSFDNDVRIPQFYDCFPNVHKILDLGSLEGAQSFQLAKHPGVYIYGIEGRKKNIEKAKLVQKYLKIENVEFIQANLENIDLSIYGSFDAVFCSGVLYHLPEPWKLIKEIQKITSQLFIWMQYASDDKANQTINGFNGFWYSEGGIRDPLSGLSVKSFWMTKSSLEKMLAQNGFSIIKPIVDNPNDINGPSITLAAWKSNK